MRNPRNAPGFDLPPVERPSSTYVIASLPRTGSTLLSRALWETGVAGAPAEYFNPSQMHDLLGRWGRIRPLAVARAMMGQPVAWRRRAALRTLPMEEYVATVQRHRTTANGVFGVTLHFGHLQKGFLDQGIDPLAALGNPRWLRIGRRDSLRQAISYVRALQTGQWSTSASAPAPTSVVEYDFERIARRRDDFRRREQGWTEWFQTRGIEPFTIEYEDFAADYEGTLRRVLRHLEIPDADRRALPPAPLRRQSDAVTEEWVERFLEDAQERSMAAAAPSGSWSH